MSAKRNAKVGDFIRITRTDLAGGNWAAGKVYRVDSLEGGSFVRVIPEDGKAGLLLPAEYEVVNKARVGEYVTPNHDDWRDWPRGPYEVLGIEAQGYRVGRNDGVEGIFLYNKADKCAAPKPEFDLARAKSGAALKFRSGCAVKFVAYVKEAKPHCQLVLLNPETGNVVTRYANGKSSTEPFAEPGDILSI